MMYLISPDSPTVLYLPPSVPNAMDNYLNENRNAIESHFGEMNYKLLVPDWIVSDPKIEEKLCLKIPYLKRIGLSAMMEDEICKYREKEKLNDSESGFIYFVKGTIDVPNFEKIDANNSPEKEFKRLIYRETEPAHITKERDRFFVNRKPHDEPPQVDPIIKILEAQSNPRPSRMSILPNNKIHLPDREITITLEPIHMALYLLLLKYPYGIEKSSLRHHKEVLLEIYMKISNRESTDAMCQTVDNLINRSRNDANEKRSRINSIFRNALNNKGYIHYSIIGERGEAWKVPIEPNLITYCQQ